MTDTEILQKYCEMAEQRMGKLHIQEEVGTFSEANKGNN